MAEEENSEEKSLLSKGSDYIRSLWDSAKKDDALAEASAKKTHGSVTNQNEEEDSSVNKFFKDVLGTAKSLFAEIKEPIITGKGWLETAIGALNQLASDVQNGITNVKKGIADKIGAAQDGFVAGVTKGVERLGFPLTDSQWAQQGKDNVVKSDDGTAPDEPGLISRASSWIGSKATNIGNAVQGKLQSGIDKLYGSAETRQAVESGELAIENTQLSLASRAGIAALSTFSKYVGSFTKSASPQALKVKGAGFISQGKAQFNDKINGLADDAASEITTLAQDSIDNLAAPVTDALDLVSSKLNFLEQQLQSIANVFNKVGETLNMLAAGVLAAVRPDITIEDMEKAGISPAAGGMLFNKQTQPSVVEQIVEAEKSFPSLPLAIKIQIRKIARAVIRSSKVIANAVFGGIEDPQTSPYNDVGAAPGSEILGYTADTANLDQEVWATSVLYNGGGNVFRIGPAAVVRSDTEYKIPNSIKNMLKGAYAGVNGYMVRCIPSEVPDGAPRAILRDIKTGAALAAHDFRWAGDTANLIAIGRNKPKYQQILKAQLGDSIDFVSYITPVQEQATVEIQYVDKTAEGFEFSVDLKGNKVVPAAGVPDSTSIA